MNKINKALACLLSAAVTLSAVYTGISSAAQDSSGISQDDQNGRLLVSFVSKGSEVDTSMGMAHLAEVAHRNNAPVTWILDYSTTAKMNGVLEEWHTAYGDEVGWLSSGSGNTENTE